MYLRILFTPLVMLFYDDTSHIVIYKHAKDSIQIQLRTRWKNWRKWRVGFWNQQICQLLLILAHIHVYTNIVR